MPSCAKSSLSLCYITNLICIHNRTTDNLFGICSQNLGNKVPLLKCLRYSCDIRQNILMQVLVVTLYHIFRMESEDKQVVLLLDLLLSHSHFCFIAFNPIILTPNGCQTLAMTQHIIKWCSEICLSQRWVNWSAISLCQRLPIQSTWVEYSFRSIMPVKGIHVYSCLCVVDQLHSTWFIRWKFEISSIPGILISRYIQLLYAISFASYCFIM